MNKILGTLALAAMIVAGAAAQGKKPKPAAKTTACPVCHMPLSAKKTKKNPVAVRLKKGDKVMYCCAGCKMPDSVLVKEKPKATKAKGKAKTK